MGKRLAEVGKKFQMKMAKIDGTVFYGQLLAIPDTSRVSNFLTPRRYLRTASIPPVVPGDVIKVQGTTYIVAQHGGGYFKDYVVAQYFKLFEVTSREDWYAAVTTTNAVTGIKEMERVNQDEQIYVSLQPKGEIKDEIHIQQQSYIAIINRAVGRNDQIGNLMVTAIDPVLGVYEVEMKEK